MRVTVKVNRRHIRAGQRGSSSCCPVALALKGLVKRTERLHVGVREVSINQYNKAPFPVCASNWIGAFDAGMTVSPIQFNLNIAARYLKGH